MSPQASWSSISSILFSYVFFLSLIVTLLLHHSSSNSSIISQSYYFIRKFTKIQTDNNWIENILILGYDRYLLIDFYLGELIQRQNGPQSIRKQILDKSRWSYRRFLTLCDAYDLLSASDKKLFEQTVDSTSGAAADPFFAAQANAGIRREAKIAKYRQEKELKMKIEVSDRYIYTLPMICFPLYAILEDYMKVTLFMTNLFCRY